MLLTSFTKQLINIYSINQFTSFPLSLHHTHKVTLLPSLRGRGWGRGFSPSFPQSHITPLPAGEGSGVGLLSTYDNFHHPTLHQEGTLTHVFPHSHPTRSCQPSHVVDPPLQTPPRCPRRPRLSEDNQVALATRSKTNNRIPGRTVAPKAQC